MKKTLALFSSLLLFTGLKAQTPAVKKETTNPASTQPGINADSLKALKNGATIKQTDKAIKYDNTVKMTDKAIKIDQTVKMTDKVIKIDAIKKANTEVPLKDAVNKPHKG